MTRVPPPTFSVAASLLAVQARVDISKGLAPGRYQARVVNGDISRPQDAKLHSLCNLVVKADGTGNCSGKVKIKAFGPTLAVSITPKASTDIVPSAIAFVR